MHYRRLGRSGLKVSEISLGSWVTFGSQIDEPSAIELFHEAYDQGVNYFDNADIYANGQAEVVMGKGIKGLPREALVLSSKVFWATMPGPNGRGLSRKHITESIHASLKRLGTDYLDLYICHRFDPDTPIDEILYTMDTLVNQGKVLYWGTSEWRAWQLTAAFLSAKDNHLTSLTVEQPQYNMFHRRRVEAELAQVVRDYGIGLMTWSPLYYGILTIVRELGKVADDLHITTAQLAIAWLLRRKDISSVVTGATSLEQLTQNVEAAEYVEKLNDEVLDRIETVLGNAPEEE
jgi:aryl-alcohol dehydrogenase-like predicted oxidoreductase